MRGVLSSVRNRNAGQHTNSKSEYLYLINESNLRGWIGLHTRPITMKKSSRPMFLVIVDFTYILARTKRVATARKIDCIAIKAEFELGLGEINERAGSLVDVAILFQLTRQDE